MAAKQENKAKESCVCFVLCCWLLVEGDHQWRWLLLASSGSAVAFVSAFCACRFLGQGRYASGVIGSLPVCAIKLWAIQWVHSCEAACSASYCNTHACTYVLDGRLGDGAFVETRQGHTPTIWVRPGGIKGLDTTHLAKHVLAPTNTQMMRHHPHTDAHTHNTAFVPPNPSAWCNTAMLDVLVPPWC